MGLHRDVMAIPFRLLVVTTCILQTRAFLSPSCPFFTASSMGGPIAPTAATSATAAPAAVRLTRRRAITEDDREAVRDAIALAQRGFGATFPNPAVGCVILGGGSGDGESQGGGPKRGAGWHPKAGFPHAEIYALADYTGRLPEALRPTKQGGSGESVGAADEELLKAYLEQGPNLFAGVSNAYVSRCCRLQQCHVDWSQRGRSDFFPPTDDSAPFSNPPATSKHFPVSTRRRPVRRRT